MRLLKQF